MSDRIPPTDPTLTPLLRERQFYAALLVGAPLLVFGYLEVARAILHGEPIDVAATIAAFSANPVTLYLAARQYPRGKAVEAVGQELALKPAIDEDLDTPADDELAAAAEAHLETIPETDGGLA